MRKLATLYLLTLFSASGWSCLTGSIEGKDLKSQKTISVRLNSNQKGTVLVFLSAKCPCSKSHEPTLEKLAKDFSDFQFVALNSNQDEEESFSSKHFQDSNLSFPVLRDAKAEIADRLKALKTPHAYVIGPQGQCWYDGGVDDTKDSSKAKEHHLKNALLDIRDGKEPKEKNVRTLGCVISR